jgi:hypothetical protein
MAWKPWFEKVAEIDAAEDREAFIRGYFGGPKPMTGKQAAGAALIAVLAGWSVNKAIKGNKK